MWRETLNLVMTKDGLPYYVDEDGEYWRVYLFIENATCYDMVKDEEDFYQSAVAFGHFQRLLADYPAETLHETIVNFHNTVDRTGYASHGSNSYDLCMWDAFPHRLSGGRSLFQDSQRGT